MTAFSKSICFCPIIFCLYLPQLASGQTRKGTPSRSLNVGIPAKGEVIASDDFSSYIPGTNGLLGQAAGGTGFTGTWQSMGVQANLDVFANPSSVGSRSTTSRNSNAGNVLNFVSPVSIGGRQLFIRYRHVNLNTANIHESSRLDVNYTRPVEGNRVILGSFVTDNLQLVLEPNLHTGVGHLIVDSGIGTVSGTGSHVVVGLLDEQFGQIAIWVDPDTNDFYNPLTGANSADAVTAWGVPAGGLTNFVSYSLFRNLDDRVTFDDVVFARVMGATKAYASTKGDKEIKSLQPKKSSMPKSAADGTPSAVGTAVAQLNNESRQVWISLTYGTTIAYKNGGTWTDTSVGTGELVSEMEFRGKTDDYIELFNLNPNARDLLRLYGDRMECKHPEGWVVIGSGHWRTKSTLGTAGPAKAAAPASSSAQILDVKIVSEPNANGRPIRVVKITWKNTGSKTIRALDGNFFIADNTRTLEPKFEYTIFACSNSEDGVKPGETYVEKDGGFALPNGCTATQAKVEITKVLEKSNF